MSITVNVQARLRFPPIWTAQNNQVHALNSIALIKQRTMRGVSSKGHRFKGYSRKPISIAMKGARLKPKGGRLSKSGKTMYFQGGYKEYKEKSRRGNIQSAEVDLTLSGILMNSIQVLEATRYSYTIGLAAQGRPYGYYVNNKRPFLGRMLKKEINILVQAAALDIKRNLKT
jgi:hypothetical protein